MQYKALQRFIILTTLCTGLLFAKTQAQTAEVSTTFSDTMLCLQGQFIVPLTITGSFHDTNVFTIEMSGSTGSFASPTIVGYAYGNGVTATSANCQLPGSITAGAGYRLRVLTNYPVYTSGPNNKNIRVSGYPNITAGGNGPLCVGDALNLTGTTTAPVPTFTWTGPGLWTATTQNPTRTNVTLNDSGSYIVTVTSYKCSTKDTIVIGILPTPVFTGFNTDSFACEGQPFSINPGCNICTLPQGIVQFQWTYPPNGTFTKSALKLLSTDLANQGWFKVTVSIGNCTSTDSFYAIIKALPDSPAATSNGPLCVGETLILSGASATPGVTYRWEGPNGQIYYTSTVTIPNVTKDYEGDWRQYAIKNGCDSKPGITKVKIGIPLIALPVTGDTMLCPGGKLQLSAQTSITEGIEWKKLPNDSVIIGISRTYGKNPVTAEDAGIYVVTQEVLGCKSPPAYINVIIPDIKNPDAKNNGPLCIGQRLDLTAATTVDGIYSWTGPNGFTSNAQNPALNDVTEAVEGTYSVTTTLAYCSSSDTTNVTVKPMPAISNISSNSPVCTYTFLDLFSESTIGGSKFEWAGPNGFTSTEQNPSIYFLDNMEGEYSVRAHADGCVSEMKTTQVIARIGPGPSKAKSNSPLNEGDRLELFAENGKDSVVFFWQGPDGFTSSEQNPVVPVATFRSSGKYELMSVYNGCTTSTHTVVYVKDILGITLELYPNPNDGKFTIAGIAQSDATIVMNIFNHQGMIVHKSEVIPNHSKFESEIDLRGSASGVYMLQLISGAEKRTIRFTIVRQ